MGNFCSSSKAIDADDLGIAEFTQVEKFSIGGEEESKHEDDDATLQPKVKGAWAGDLEKSRNRAQEYSPVVDLFLDYGLDDHDEPMTKVPSKETRKLPPGVAPPPGLAMPSVPPMAKVNSSSALARTSKISDEDVVTAKLTCTTSNKNRTLAPLKLR